MSDVHPTTPERAKRYLRNGLSLIFLAGAIYALVVAVSADGPHVELYGLTLTTDDAYVRFLQALAGMVVVQLVPILERLTKLKISFVNELAFQLFIILALLLGSHMGLYLFWDEWDKPTHFYFSAFAAINGYALWALSTEQGQAGKSSRRTIGVILALGFAALAGTLWEIFEFSVDAIDAARNTQRYMLHDGTPLIGRAALMDTMGDIIMNTLGSVVGLIFLLIWEGHVRTANPEWHFYLRRRSE